MVSTTRDFCKRNNAEQRHTLCIPNPALCIYMKKIGMEEVLEYCIPMSEYKEEVKKADIHFIQDKHDMKPYKHFKKFFIISSLRRDVVPFVAGIKQGIKQGIEKGIEQGIFDIISRMLKKGKSVQEIVGLTDYEEAKVQKVADALENC